MLSFLKTTIIKWLKRPFAHNPLVETPSLYLAKVGQAYYIWLACIVGCFVLAFGGIILFVVGVIHGWF
ncbi:MAG: hypothetical protein WCV88_01500 [Patescibacteria group bacterium]|jgi:hypothetical protein